MTGVQHKIVGVGFGLASAYITVAGKGDPYGSLIAVSSIVGCMLPDIDHDKTKIGRKRAFLTNLTTKVANTIVVGGIALGVILILLMWFGMVESGIEPMKLYIFIIGLLVIAFLKKVVGDSEIFKWATRHRGLMHTLVVPAILYIGMRVSDFPLYHYTILGLLVGYCSHLFADMLTIEGCPVLFPLTRKNIRFPTRFKTKDKVCTTAAYTVAFMAVIGAYFYVKIF